MSNIILKHLQVAEDDAHKKAVYALLHGINHTSNVRTGQFAVSINYDHSKKELTLLLDPINTDTNKAFTLLGYKKVSNQYKKVIEYNTKISKELSETIQLLSYDSKPLKLRNKVEVQVAFPFGKETPENELAPLRHHINKQLNRKLFPQIEYPESSYPDWCEENTQGVIDFKHNSRQLILDLALTQEALAGLINMFPTSNLQLSLGAGKHPALHTEFQVLEFYQDHRTGAHCVFKEIYDGMPYKVEFYVHSEANCYLEMGIQSVTNLKTGEVIDDGDAVTEFFGGDDSEENYDYQFKNAIENYFRMEIRCG